MKIVFAIVAGVALGFGARVFLGQPEFEPAEPVVIRDTAAYDAAEARVGELEAENAELLSQLDAARTQLLEVEAAARRASENQVEEDDPVESPTDDQLAAAARGDGVPIAPGTKRDRWGLPEGEELSAEDILELIESENPRDRIRGLRALTSLPDRQRAIEIATEMMGDGPPWLRMQAMQTLSELDPTGAATAISGLLTDDTGWVASAAARTLGDLGDPMAIQPLRDAFSTGDDRTRVSAALSLRKLGDNGATTELAQTALVNLSNPDGSLREQALRSLTMLEDSAYNVHFQSSLSDSNSDVRRAAAHALGMQGTSSDLSSLQSLLSDPVNDVVRAAERAINMIQNPEMREERNGWGRRR